MLLLVSVSLFLSKLATCKLVFSIFAFTKESNVLVIQDTVILNNSIEINYYWFIDYYQFLSVWRWSLYMHFVLHMNHSSISLSYVLKKWICFILLVLFTLVKKKDTSIYCNLNILQPSLTVRTFNSKNVNLKINQYQILPNHTCLVSVHMYIVNKSFYRL